MHRFRPLLVWFSCLFFWTTLWAGEGYMGEDLWTDIYRKIDEGTFRVHKQMVENKLKDSTKLINATLGKTCLRSRKESFCFRSGADFTAEELDEITAGGFGPIYAHMEEGTAEINTNQIVEIQKTIKGIYATLQNEAKNDQKKLQEISSIGLFNDGDRDNSGYDLMADLEDIHNVLFAHDIPYEGTANLGSRSLAELLRNGYQSPPSLPGLPPSSGNSWTINGGEATLSGALTLSGIVNSESCVVSDLPGNLDSGLMNDIWAQLSGGRSSRSQVAFADNARLPEQWARMGGSSGWAGGGTDQFPCSKTDIFCIMISFSKYGQDILAGGKAFTIEKILDENLKIANAFAGTSLVQTKMPTQFFASPFKNFNLPSMVHLRVVISKLPPPILNLPPDKGSWGGYVSPGEEDEFNKILVGTFGDVGLDYKRQNSLEDHNTSRALANLTYLDTNVVNAKLDTSTASPDAEFAKAEGVEIRKSYGDSFNDDLFELSAFTEAFSEKITKDITSLIKAFNAIPTK